MAMLQRCTAVIAASRGGIKRWVVSDDQLSWIFLEEEVNLFPEGNA